MIATRGTTAYSGMGHYQTPPLAASIRFVADPDTADERAWAALIDDLLALRGLKDDWDGLGAEAPHPALVDSAIKLVQRRLTGRMPPADRVIPGVNGTIFFEWHIPDSYTEIEVIAPDQADVSVVAKGSAMAEVFPLVNWLRN